jgi:hypothetical protein
MFRGYRFKQPKNGSGAARRRSGILAFEVFEPFGVIGLQTATSCSTVEMWPDPARSQQGPLVASVVDGDEHDAAVVGASGTPDWSTLRQNALNSGTG